MGLHGGLNSYRYTQNPVDYIDPFGLCDEQEAQKGVFASLKDGVLNTLAWVDEKTTIPALADLQTSMLEGLDEMGARAHASGNSWAVPLLGVTYAATYTLMPTSALDVVPGGKAGKLGKLGDNTADVGGAARSAGVPNKKLFGDNLNSKVELEANALIAAGKTDGVAISRAGIPELGIVGESFQNIPFSLRKGRTFPGTERFGENNGFIRITDQNAYLDEVTRLYAKTGNDLNPVMREQIKAHVKQGAEFGLRDDKGLKGIPGLHAEVQSANYVLNQVKATPGFDIGRVQVSTYKLQNSPGQGAPFTACNHCSGILQGFDILTGH